MKQTHALIPSIARTPRAGFTIVELLIVAAVIVVLATITAVGYNGVLLTSRTKSAQTSALTVQRKIEAYASITNAYPVATTIASYTAALSTYGDSTLQSTGLTIGAPIVSTGTTTVEVSQCATTAGAGYRIRYYDFSSNGFSSDVIIGSLSGTTCSSWNVLN